MDKPDSVDKPEMWTSLTVLMLKSVYLQGNSGREFSKSYLCELYT